LPTNYFGDKPGQWSETDMNPLPKSGDFGLTDNYMGITLSSVASKIINKMLLNRIRPVIDQHLRPNQNGFRPDEVKKNNISKLLCFLWIFEKRSTVNKAKVLTSGRENMIFQDTHRSALAPFLFTIV